MVYNVIFFFGPGREDTGYIYHIVRKFGEDFNLVIWRSRRKLPDLIPPL